MNRHTERLKLENRDAIQATMELNATPLEMENPGPNKVQNSIARRMAGVQSSRLKTQDRRLKNRKGQAERIKDKLGQQISQNVLGQVMFIPVLTQNFQGFLCGGGSFAMRE